MATPKKYPIDDRDKPGPSSSPRKPTSSASASGPVSIPQDPSQNAQPFKYFQVAFIGQPGSGRNSLAWRMSNLDAPELPSLPLVPRREVILETSTRPALKHSGVVSLQVRIVPPDDFLRQPFFDKNRGEVNKCEAMIFVVDLGNERSSDDFYVLHNKVKRNSQQIPPFLIVGTKVDLRLFGVVTPHSWGETTANLYRARGYVECSPKTGERVGDVLDALLRILL